jgi:hypothetical protein
VSAIVTDARVTSKLLTGLSITGSAILATDTILQAFGKVQNQLNGKQGTITLTTTGSSNAATLIGNTLNVPNYTLAGLGGVPTTRTITINGTSQDLSADRTFSVGTVTSVGLSMPSAFSVASSPITGSGTIAVTGAGLASQYIRGDGQLADFPTSGGGGGSSVSYYLNGSVNQGTFGGNVYKEMNKVPVLGTGTDFTINADGYIAQFLTDAADPGALLIPAGNWNFETYFSASSGGGTPSFYVELYKFDGTTFSAIASNSGTPELISFGTSIQPYFSNLAVPETVLTVTDRLAVRIYVLHSSKTITLHTEGAHLCQIVTTFTTGLQSLNGLSKQVQYFAVGSAGTDFGISSATDTHTFNLPTASATNRGALSSANWSTFNGKQDAITLTTTGSSNAATLIGSTLNIPNYSTDLSGYVPYTGATATLQMGTNNGITLTDTGTNVSIAITSSSTGQGALVINKSVNGSGVVVNNAGIGFGIYANNTSTGSGIAIGNSSTGKGLYIDNAAAATGDPFAYSLNGVANIKAKIDYIGNITGQSFIPSGSTVPTNGMYLSAANTLNFATNSTSQLSISSGGTATFIGALRALSVNVFYNNALTNQTGNNVTLATYTAGASNELLQITITMTNNNATGQARATFTYTDDNNQSVTLGTIATVPLAAYGEGQAVVALNIKASTTLTIVSLITVGGINYSSRVAITKIL